MQKLMQNKKGAFEIVNSSVSWVIGLVIMIIIGFVIVSTLNSAGLLTTGSNEQNATNQLISNFTTGVNNVSNKLPTIFLISAVVIILAILMVLWAYYKRMGLQGSGSGL